MAEIGAKQFLEVPEPFLALIILHNGFLDTLPRQFQQRNLMKGSTVGEGAMGLGTDHVICRHSI